MWVAAISVSLRSSTHVFTQEYDGASQLADTCFVQWLGVPAEKANLNQRGYNAREPQQGKGLGKRLLARSLVEMHVRGYTRAIISTALGNHRAQLFYVCHVPSLVVLSARVFSSAHTRSLCSAMLCNADYFRFQGQRLDPRLDSHRVAPANKINLSRCGSEVVILPLNVYLWLNGLVYYL
jgi:hypothetical protein